VVVRTTVLIACAVASTVPTLAVAQPCGVMQNIGTPAQGSKAWNVNRDGSVIVGGTDIAANQTRSFRWTAATLVSRFSRR